MASITLTWNDNSTRETGYRVQYRAAGSLEWITAATTAANATSRNVSGLLNSTDYEFRVGTVRGGVVSWSLVVSSRTAPAAPSGLQLTVVDDERIDLAWTNNASDATSYHVERSLDGDAWTEIAELGVVAGYSNTGLAGDTTYYYRVRAKRGDVWTGYTDAVSAMTAPAMPTGVAVGNPTADSLDISWDDNSTTEDGFEIQRSNDGVGGWVTVAETAANATGDTDGTIDEATRYFYRVRAFRDDAVRVFSRWSDVIHGWTAPNAPTGLIATTGASPGVIDLSWNDNSAGETAYEVQESPDDSDYTTLTNTLPANTTTYQVTGLGDEVMRFYRVRAIVSGIPSDWSNSDDATTMPTGDPIREAIMASAIAYWPLDSGYNDYSGNGHHLADLASVKSGNDLHGTQPATGKVGGAAGFTEPDDPPGEPEDYSAGLVRLNTSDTFQFGGILERSINVWIKRGGHGWRVFGCCSGSATDYWALEAGDSFFGVVVEAGLDPVSVQASSTLNVDTWYMLTVTAEYHEGSGEEEPQFLRFRFYVDGTLVSTQDSPGFSEQYGPGSRANVAVVDPIPDDGDYPNDPSSHFWGDVDELLFVDRILTQEEITWLYGPEGQGRSLLQ